MERRNETNDGGLQMGGAKARKLFARGGELIYDEMHNGCAFHQFLALVRAVLIDVVIFVVRGALGTYDKKK